MSVAAYVGRKVVRELRMPKGVSDGLGIRYDGAVLTGETTPEAKLRAEALRGCDGVLKPPVGTPSQMRVNERSR